MKLGRLHAVLCAALMLGAVGLDAAAQKTDAVRPEVGKPLQEAATLMKSGKTREALAKVNEADAVANKTPNESFLVLRMRGSVAAASGDTEGANKSFEAVLNSGKVSGRDSLSMIQAIAVNNYKAKDYAKAVQWTQRYFKEGGTDPSMRTVLLQSYYLSNDCANVNRMLAGAEDRHASEEELQMLANCYDRQKDTAGYVGAIEKLVVSYPKKSYWNDLLARVQKKPGFSDRLGVNVYRLRLATGNLNTTNDYLEMAQLALQAGVPAEAKVIVDKGYEAKVLGQGPEAARHQRLRDLVMKDLAESKKNRAKDEQAALDAKDGNELVKVGLNYVYEGNADKGLALIEQGIKRGGLKRPEDAKLRLGEAQIYAGQKAKGVQTLKTVQGSDGTADIARLWILNARA
jgi:outer membrane protein assembly factor BamD (BamD/ComL family)